MTDDEIMRLAPAGHHILIRKCYNRTAGPIVLPDKSRDRTNWVEIMAVGPRCEYFGQDDVGRLTLCRERVGAPGDMECVSDDGETWWLVREIGTDGIPVLQLFTVGEEP